MAESAEEVMRIWYGVADLCKQQKFDSRLSLYVFGAMFIEYCIQTNIDPLVMLAEMAAYRAAYSTSRKDH